MARKTDKPRYAKAIVQALRNHEVPSRFLRMNETTGMWEDVGDRRAAEKVSQALREKEKKSRLKEEKEECTLKEEEKNDDEEKCTLKEERVDEV
jgi:hypothetical protein